VDERISPSAEGLHSVNQLFGEKLERICSAQTTLTDMPMSDDCYHHHHHYYKPHKVGYLED
jgi:hypothetical protein